MATQIIFRNLAEAYQAIEELKKLPEFPEIRGDWNLYENLVHCSQSIEFSLRGFPQEKSWLFQHTVGALAYKIFENRGYMNHNTHQAIPASPLINPDGKILSGILRLQKAIVDFDNFQEAPVQPHFAYGKLSKSQLDKANAMHIANHWELFIL